MQPVHQLFVGLFVSAAAVSVTALVLTFLHAYDVWGAEHGPTEKELDQQIAAAS